MRKPFAPLVCGFALVLCACEEPRQATAAIPSFEQPLPTALPEDPLTEELFALSAALRETREDLLRHNAGDDAWAFARDAARSLERAEERLRALPELEEGAARRERQLILDLLEAARGEMQEARSAGIA